MNRTVSAFSFAVIVIVGSALVGCATSGETARPAPEDADEEESRVEEAVQQATPEPTEADPTYLAPSPASLGVDLDTVQAGRFDNGKMWTFEHPPIDYFAEAYDFRPDTTWFAEAQQSALRIPGCSASFVSPNGLVMTNHHCGRSAVTAVTRPGENLVDDGFYAASLDEERRVDDYYADQLVDVTDVTDEVYAALEAAETDAERAQARQDAVERVQARLEAQYDDPDVRVEVTPLYHGGLYSAYTYRRYTDVRLVMTPELQLGYFGGDTDNFTYPRYALDMTFFRVYDDAGEPLQPDHYFTWSDTGVESGDLVFAIGNPGSTYRGETVAQLTFRRDVQEPAVLRLFTTRIDALQAYYEAHRDEPGAGDVRNTIFSLRNGAKLYRGRVEALQDPVIMARRQDMQDKLVDAIQGDSTLQATYGGLVERMADIQEQKRSEAAPYGAFLGIGSSAFSAATTRRALAAVQYLRQREQGIPADSLGPLREQILGVEDQPEELQVRLLAARLTDVDHYLADRDSALVSELLQGRTPHAAAEDVVAATVLADSAATARALAEGTLSMDDPAVRAAHLLFPHYQAFQSAYAGLQAQEREIASMLGRARYDVYGTSVPPDATFTLRIADGVVRGYRYNGTMAPPYTTFYGLYDHYYSYGPGSEWDLPERWLTPPDGFELATPVNFVSTADITGGNSGSPVINEQQEIVGLIFDGNIESLVGDYIYLEEGVRAVSVDARGMLEALDDMYGADRLVLELTTDQFVPSEQEADVVLSGGSR